MAEPKYDALVPESKALCKQACDFNTRSLVSGAEDDKEAPLTRFIKVPEALHATADPNAISCTVDIDKGAPSSLPAINEDQPKMAPTTSLGSAESHRIGYGAVPSQKSEQSAFGYLPVRDASSTLVRQAAADLPISGEDLEAPGQDQTYEGIRKIRTDQTSKSGMSAPTPADRENVQRVLQKASIQAANKRNSLGAKRYRHISSALGKIIAFMFISMVVSVLLLHDKKPEGGWHKFGPRESMVTGDVLNLIFLLISRLTAYAMYPAIIVVFLTKCHFSRTRLFFTLLRLYVRVERAHHLHVQVGWIVYWMTNLHCIFHLIRWARREEMHLLYEHYTGVTGLVSWICCVLIVNVMGIDFFRKRIKWEIRKGLHSILGSTMIISIAGHANATNIFWVCGITFAIWVLDYIYVQTFRTFLVQNCRFRRLPDGVVVEFDDPPGFHAQLGGYYINLCVPFISVHQFHAFTCYPHKDNLLGKQSKTALCIVNNGDWTKTLHDETAWHTCCEAWIQGPFLSPYASVLKRDNAICVASGSGITAALGAMNALGNDRRINLIWICRDASVVEFYLENHRFADTAYTLIYYTGRRKLQFSIALPNQVFIFNERPKLKNAVATIIWMIETGSYLPEEMIHEKVQIEQDAVVYQQSLTRALTPIEDMKRNITLALQSFKEFELHAFFEALDDEPSVGQIENLFFKAFGEVATSDYITEVLSSLPPLPTTTGTTKQRLNAVWCEVLDANMKKATVSAMASLSEELSQRFLGTEGENELQKWSRKGEFDVRGSGKSSARENMISKGWSVLYCGGSAPVNKDLTDVCQQFKIDYQQEGFSW